MKTVSATAAALLLASTATAQQQPISDVAFKSLYSDLEGCIITMGACFDEDAGNFVYRFNDRATCNNMNFLTWKAPFQSWKSYKEAVIAKGANTSGPQLFLARVAGGNRVSTSAMSTFTSATVSYEDYLRCEANGREFVYLFGTPEDVQQAMDASTMKFDPVQPVAVPDVLKVSPVISNQFVIPEGGDDDARGPVGSTVSVRIALTDGGVQTFEDSKLVAQAMENTLNNRRRRRRLATGEYMAPVTVEARSHRSLVAHQVDGFDILFDGDNILSQNPRVKFVEPLANMTTSNIDASLFIQSGTSLPRGGSLNNLGDSNLPFYAAGITGEGQVVGVGDSGLDTRHCMFRDAQVSVVPVDGETNNYPTHRKVSQYTAFVDGSDPYSGHGTHVAGTVAGDDGSTSGRGIAYGAKLALFDMGDSTNPRLIETPEPLDKAFDDAAKVEARIHTNSWGDDEIVSYDTLCQDVDRYSFENQDYLVLFAAGNSGYKNNGGVGSIGSPAISKNSVTVGAQMSSSRSMNGCEYSGSSKCTDNLASFSSNGPLFDKRISPDVVAIGKTVASARASTSSDSCQYTKKGGTSMATPAVAGAAALVRQYFMDGFYPTGSAVTNNKMTPMAALVKATLINSGTFLKGKYSRYTLSKEPSNVQGFGSVTLGNTLPLSDTVADDLFVVGDFENMKSLESGQQLEYEFEVNSASQFKVTLVWSDAPASTTANTALVNDLDLVVVRDSDKEEFFPNGLTERDVVNNVEQVDLKAGTYSSGRYIVRVRGATVPKGPQAFALVVSGSFQVSDSSDARASTFQADLGDNLERTVEASTSDDETKEEVTSSMGMGIGIGVGAGLVAGVVGTVLISKQVSSTKRDTSRLSTTTTAMENPKFGL